MLCADAHDLAAVGCGIAEPDHVGHGSAFILWRRRLLT
jgi:hypothetical protein